MMFGTKTKQPSEQLDYTIDYSRWLPEGDVILTVETHVDPPYDVANSIGLNITAAHIQGQDITVWCAEGEDGKTYKVTVIAGTQDGRIKEVDFKIRVRDC